MKLSKKLIVTGLLFSSVLGSVNVGSITAMAAININNIPKPEGPAVSNPENTKPSEFNKKFVSVKYLDSKGNEINDPALDRYARIPVGLSDRNLNTSKISLPSKYKVAKNEIVKISDNNTVAINLNEYKLVNIKYVGSDNFRITDKALNTEISIPVDSNKLSLEQLNLPSNYRLLSKADSFDVVDNKVIVKVEEVKTININYTVNGKNASISGFVKNVNVPYKAQTVSLKEINNDFANYKIKDNKTEFTINNGSVTIELESAPINNINVEFNKPVRVDFLKGKEVVKSTNIEVKESSKTVSIKDIKAPEGYKILSNQVENIVILKDHKDRQEHVLVAVTEDTGDLSAVGIKPNVPEVVEPDKGGPDPIEIKPNVPEVVEPDKGGPDPIEIKPNVPEVVEPDKGGPDPIEIKPNVPEVVEPDKGGPDPIEILPGNHLVPTPDKGNIGQTESKPEPGKGGPDPIEITHPENVRKISIVFVSENGGDMPMPHSTLEVTKDAKSLKESNITLPSGYELVTNQDLTIKKVGNLEYVKVKIKKTNAAEQQESVKLNFVDDKGFSITDSKLPKTVNVKKNSTKLELKNVKLPQGYKFANNDDVFIKNGEATIKIEKANVVKVNVVYVDKDTKKTISSVKLSGSYGTANKLDIPAGYKVVDGSSNVVKFGKDGAVVTVVVEKVTPITNHKSTITTYPGSFVSLYNQKGQYIQNRGLGENSSWVSDKTMVLDGVKYYRVSTNEWVKAEAVYEYTPMANKTITTTKGSFKKLYTTRGKAVGNRGLGANSSWLTDKAATINGETMYRVATNEWIKASDIK